MTHVDHRVDTKVGTTGRNHTTVLSSRRLLATVRQQIRVDHRFRLGIDLHCQPFDRPSVHLAVEDRQGQLHRLARLAGLGRFRNFGNSWCRELMVWFEKLVM